MSSAETIDAKARRYLGEGRVLVEQVDDEVVRALVAGSDVYEVVIERAGASCSCPARRRCAHLAAVEPRHRAEPVVSVVTVWLCGLEDELAVVAGERRLFRAGDSPGAAVGGDEAVADHVLAGVGVERLGCVRVGPEPVGGRLEADRADQVVAELGCGGVLVERCFPIDGAGPI